MFLQLTTLNGAHSGPNKNLISKYEKQVTTLDTRKGVLA